MHTDEYQISLGREIVVCRSKIDSVRKALARLEAAYVMTTEKVLSESGHAATIPSADLALWREEAAALASWSERLRQYQDLYEQHKK